MRNDYRLSGKTLRSFTRSKTSNNSGRFRFKTLGCRGNHGKVTVTLLGDKPGFFFFVVV